MKVFLSLTILISSLFAEIIAQANPFNYHSYYDMNQIKEKSHSGSFQSCYYKMGGIYNDVHFKDQNNNFTKEHNALHKKISDAFKRGHFQSSGKSSDIYFDGVAFVANQ